MTPDTTPLPTESMQTPLPELGLSQQLLARARDGDEVALGDLLARYRQRILSVVRIRVGQKLASLIEPDDLVQEVMIIATRKLVELEPTSHASILNWLTKVAENVIRGHVAFHRAKRRDADRAVPLDAGEGEGPAGKIPASGPSPSSHARRRELQDLLDGRVRELEPEHYREVIVLRDYLCCEWEEVRERLDRPSVSAAQELHRRAMVRLRRLMRPYLG